MITFSKLLLKYRHPSQSNPAYSGREEKVLAISLGMMIKEDKKVRYDCDEADEEEVEDEDINIRTNINMTSFYPSL